MSNVNKFHEHLDVCEQCRENPFDLCKSGLMILNKTVNEIILSNVNDANKENKCPTSNGEP